MLEKIFKIGISVGICLGLGFISSILTAGSIPGWYDNLNKPWFNPPNWIFGPAWSVLYILMGISLYLFFSAKGKHKQSGLYLFFLQLALNFFWSILFFGLRNPLLAAVDILLLWAAILLTIKSFYKISKTASYLLMPYIAWVSFATILNISILILNP